MAQTLALKRRRPNLSRSSTVVIGLYKPHQRKHARRSYTINDSSSVPRKMDDMLENDRLTDVKFIVGRKDSINCQQRSFYGLRSLFAAQSKVFEAMLFGNMKESQQTNQVLIQDVTPSAFDFLHKTIHFIGSPQLTFSIVVDVMYIANKYIIKSLLTRCERKILSVNNTADLNVIFHAFAQYAPSTFDDFMCVFYLKCAFLKKCIDQCIDKELFLKFPMFQMKQFMKNEHIIQDQWTKYKLIKQYCEYQTSAKKQRANSANHLNMKWQCLFKQFIEFIKFEKIPETFLINKVRSHDIMNSDDMLNVIAIKYENGFRLKHFLLSKSEVMNLSIGDKLDVRDWSAQFYRAEIIKVIGNYKMRLHFIGFGEEFDKTYNRKSNEFYAEFGSITNRKSVQKKCMKGFKKHDIVYVNYGYCPFGKFMNQWVKCIVQNRDCVSQQISVKPFDEKLRKIYPKEYYVHPDSKDECACSLNCNSCVDL